MAIELVSVSPPGFPAGCQVTSMKRGFPWLMRSNRLRRFTAPAAVRGGKNSKENHVSLWLMFHCILSMRLDSRVGEGSRGVLEPLEDALDTTRDGGFLASRSFFCMSTKFGVECTLLNVSAFSYVLIFTAVQRSQYLVVARTVG